MGERGKILVLDFDEKAYFEKYLSRTSTLMWNTTLPLAQLAWYIDNLFETKLSRKNNITISFNNYQTECRLLLYDNPAKKQTWCLIDNSPDDVAGITEFADWNKMLLLYGINSLQSITDLVETLYHPYPTSETVNGNQMEEIRKSLMERVYQTFKWNFRYTGYPETDMFTMEKISGRQKRFLNLYKEYVLSILMALIDELPYI